MNEFGKSANTIDIIQLSLHRYSKPQGAARFRSKCVSKLRHFMSKDTRLVYANTGAPSCTC